MRNIGNKSGDLQNAKFGFLLTKDYKVISDISIRIDSNDRDYYETSKGKYFHPESSVTQTFNPRWFNGNAFRLSLTIHWQKEEKG